MHHLTSVPLLLLKILSQPFDVYCGISLMVGRTFNGFSVIVAILMWQLFVYNTWCCPATLVWHANYPILWENALFIDIFTLSSIKLHASLCICYRYYISQDLHLHLHLRLTKVIKSLRKIGLKISEIRSRKKTGSCFNFFITLKLNNLSSPVFFRYCIISDF